jgi:hypothetical protein
VPRKEAVRFSLVFMTFRRQVSAPPRPSALGALVALLLASAGCDGSGGTPPIDSGPLYSCETETRAVPYAANLERMFDPGAYKAVLTSADPAPPAKGDNTWTVRILDADGMPVDGLTITPSAIMPDHGHPPSVKPVATPAGDGAYSITPLYLFMAGYWEVTLQFQPAGSAKQTVVFPICIPG